MESKKLDESIQKKLDARFEAMTTDEGWRNYLDEEFKICQKNYGRKYSVNNAFLIDIQFPGATIVGGFHFFRSMGYTVDEKSRIQIFGPGRKKSFTVTEQVEGEDQEVRKEYMYYPVAKVFDISQTKEYKEMTPPSHSDRFLKMEQILEGVPEWIPVYDEKWSIEYSGSVPETGKFDREGRRVIVSTQGSREQQAISMLTQWCHFYLHRDLEKEEFDQDILSYQIEAQSAAYVLGSMVEGLRPDPGGIRFIARNLDDLNGDAAKMSSEVHRVVKNTADFLFPSDLPEEA